jgi:hypothetical protein
MPITDICERKHGGAETSQEAFNRIEPNLTKARNEVLLAVEMAGDVGLTCKEHSMKSGKGMNAISGRFTELARDGWIDRTNDKRDGCIVWRATI